MTLSKSKDHNLESFKTTIIKLFIIEGLGNQSITNFIYSFFNNEIHCQTCIPSQVSEINFENISTSRLNDFNNLFNFNSKDLHRLNIGKRIFNLIEKNRIFVLDQYDKIVDFLRETNIKVVSFWEKEYPKKLKHIHNFPLILFYKGTYNINQNQTISIVGSRNTSSYGLNFITNLISKLKNSKLAIASGLAIGTDIHVHIESLKNNIPTIAVLPCGIDQICPAKHTEISEEIKLNGLILAENLPFSKVTKFNFPIRNRIIAGISDATLVIEASKKSGALITSNFAFENDRDVFALPGDIHRETSEGCNYLIKNQKAHLLTEPKDILDFFGIKDNSNQHLENNNKNNSLLKNLTIDEKRIYKFIDENKKEVSLEFLIQSINDIKDLEVCIMSMQMKGVINDLPGNKITILT